MLKVSSLTNTEAGEPKLSDGSLLVGRSIVYIAPIWASGVLLTPEPISLDNCELVLQWQGAQRVWVLTETTDQYTESFVLSELHVSERDALKAELATVTEDYLDAVRVITQKMREE
jgi:hypothetical protein